MSLNNRPVRPRARVSSEQGIAMLTTLLVLMLMSALLVGFTAVIMSDQRYRFIDRDRGQAFYAAAGGIEKLTADLGNLFFSTISPTGTQVTALTYTKPSITGVTYTATNAPTPLPASTLTTYHCGPAPKTISTVGANGYTIMFCTDATGNPVTTSTSPIKNGPYEGLIAEQIPYQLDVMARTSTGGEVHLIRSMDAVAIPVFQFGMFSDVDLAFFAGPNFDFGGRVHTNGNLFLAEGAGSTLTLRDKVTAVKEIIRQKLQNGVSIDVSTHTGTVSMAKAPGCTNVILTSCRALLRTEGSVVDSVGSALNDPTWHNASLSTYNSWIRNGRTGAKALNLPLLTVGGTNPDLIRRPAPGENTTNPVLFAERLFSKSSIRILLSDTAASITGMPTVTATAPVQLDGDWVAAPPNNGTAYGPVNSTHPPIARTIGPISTTVAAGSTATTINVADARGFLPALRLNSLAVTCTSKDATHFLSCTGAMPVTLFPVPGATVTAGVGLSTATTAATLVADTQIKVVSTTAFNPAPFWIGNTLVSCTGYTATQFSNCAGLAAAPAVGAVVTTNSLATAGTGLIGGYIKIEEQDANGVWTDITMQMLNYGIGGLNLDTAGQICNGGVEINPDAIIRIQRLRDNGGAAGGGCNYDTVATGLNDARNWRPNVLFDPREALQRDVAPVGGNLVLGGVMHYIAIDANNVAKWFRGTAPYAAGTGANARKDNGGFTIYFSDRRNNRTTLNAETAEYGWEDFVNPNDANGAPNNVLDVGEDLNANTTLETYGGLPNYNGASGAVPPGAAAPLDGTARPTTSLTPGQAQVNRSILFRHALKLINGANLGATGITGLSVVSENPVYVQGNWNANGAFNDPHVATAVMGDAITLLSGNWNDVNSFKNPYTPGNRTRGGVDAWYRMAIISGKGMAFPQPVGTATDFGTDGGAHNFLRYLESGNAVNYRGSIATFFYNRQAVGVYKCCTTVYSAPTRNYAFDIEFLDPAKLPPNTPVFRDMNAVGFSQELRPGK